MILRKYVIILWVILFTLSLAGFTQTPELAVALEAPTNGSPVSSLTSTAATGTIVVNATVDDAPWSGGGVNYTITGPKAESGSSVTESFSNLPTGTYAVTYTSGGPAGAPLVDISPSPIQTLSSGGTMAFTLNFNTQPTGTIVVNATLDGSPWSGGVNYTITGPKTESGSSVTQSFSHLPTGTYAVTTYTSGGPAGAPLVNISPSPIQMLSSGGTVAFTLNFFTRNTATIVVRATLDGSPWSGPLYFVISGTKGDSASMVPRKFYNLPTGVYTASRSSNGPPGARLDSITPSPTQDLSTGGTITFTFNFIPIDES